MIWSLYFISCHLDPVFKTLLRVPFTQAAHSVLCPQHLPGLLHFLNSYLPLRHNSDFSSSRKSSLIPQGSYKLHCSFSLTNLHLLLPHCGCLPTCLSPLLSCKIWEKKYRALAISHLQPIAHCPVMAWAGVSALHFFAAPPNSFKLGHTALYTKLKTGNDPKIHELNTEMVDYAYNGNTTWQWKE